MCAKLHMVKVSVSDCLCGNIQAKQIEKGILELYRMEIFLLVYTTANLMDLESISKLKS